MQNNYLPLTNPYPAMAVTLDEQKDLAILFLDIRNFTGLMESQPEQAVIQVVRRLFTGFNQIVKNFSGKVVEMAGDSLYAVFGLQDNLRTAVNNAYNAARAMLATVDIFNNAYTSPYDGGPLAVGIGLHAGSAFVSEFALDGPQQLSVMGLNVNIASRLQAKTRELNNDLILSEEAYNLIVDHEDFTHKTIELHGVSKPQPIVLAGKSYEPVSRPAIDFDYLLAISG